MFKLHNVDPTSKNVSLFDPFKNDNDTQEIVSDLQSNILKGHGRDRALLFFLKFNENEIHEVKEKIACFAKYVTPFKLQIEEAEQYRKHRVPGGTIVNFFLTANGYKALGEPYKSQLEEKFPDEYFLKGMSDGEIRENLKDPDPLKTWDENYLEEKKEIIKKTRNRTIGSGVKEIHALLMFADNDESNLGQKVRIFLRDVLEIGVDRVETCSDEEETTKKNPQKFVEIVTAEHAILQKNNYGEVIEHFGFRDGVSNPLFLEDDERKVTNYGGESEWDPRAPLDLVLIQDPYGENGPNSLGSYFVYRKYEQHVMKFETLIRNLAHELYSTDPSEKVLEKMRALVMGRFKDGIPIAFKNEPRRYYDENYNNFNYSNDSMGNRCPFHAHIRKVNPRLREPKETHPKDENVPFIVRRGMTYGERPSNSYDPSRLSSLPDNDVGLLFMSFQASIEKQFAHIQKFWANNSDFPELRAGRDSVIGQIDDNSKNSVKYEPKRWPLEWDKPKYSYSNAISSCISLRGGEFFFAPSISFLRNINQVASNTPRKTHKVSATKRGKRKKKTR